MEKERQVSKKLNDKVVQSFRLILCVPLGPNDEDEYLAMKGQVNAACEAIAKAGKFVPELREANRQLIEGAKQFMAALERQAI